MQPLRAPSEFYSPQLGAVTGGQNPFNAGDYEKYIETQATMLPMIEEVDYNRRMQREALQMQRDEIARQRRDANIALGIKGTQTAVELGTNPTVQKYGAKVWNALTPKPPQMPVTNMAPVNYMQTGAGTSGGSVQPGTFQTQSMEAITPSYTPELPVSLVPADFEVIGSAPLSGTATGGMGTGMPGEYGSTLPATPATGTPSTMSRIGGFKGIDVTGGEFGKVGTGLGKLGLGAAADYAIKRSNFGEYMGKGFGGEKEWDLAASTLASFALGGPVGAGLNLATAGVQAYFKKNPKLSCIIVTACTSIDSEEVQIARAYRDKYMDTQTRRGYYILADQLVPILQSNEELKKLCLEYLVLPMVRFGRWKLNKTSEHPSPTDCSITKNFLALCHDIGGTVKRYTRANSEEEI